MSGSGTAAGAHFETRVAAWLAVQILAETRRSDRLPLAADVVVNALHCQTVDPIDDIVARLSSGGRLFIQAKTNVAWRGNDAEFAKVVDQFVRQWGSDGRKRTLHADDRYVLAVSPNSPDYVRTKIRPLLQTLRGQRGDDREKTLAGLDEKGRGYLEAFNSLVDKILGPSHLLSEEARADLLDRVFVLSFDLDETGGDRAAAISILQGGTEHAVLHDPTEATSAWTALVDTCANFGVHERGGDRAYFAERLQRKGLAVRPDSRLSPAIDTLRSRSAAFLESLRSHTRLDDGSEDGFVIDRGLTQALVESLESGDLLVTGEAGAGKSGLLYTVAQQLMSDNRDLLLLPVDRFQRFDLNSLATALGLPGDRSLIETLAGWTGSGGGVVVIDALDQAKTTGNLRDLETLVTAIRTHAPRWRVLASVRRFDLKQNAGLQRLFSDSGGAEWPDSLSRDDRFPGLRTAAIPRLSDAELNVVCAAMPRLADAFANTDGRLRELCGNVFNLSLLTQLLAHQTSTLSLDSIRTQNDLLDAYWKARVADSDTEAPKTPSRHDQLMRLVDAMIAARRTRVAVPEGLHCIRELSSSRVLKTDDTSTPGLPPHVEFSHNLLLDYVVSIRWIGSLADATLNRCEAEPELLLAFRYSLRLCFERLWTHHDRFWKSAIAWQQSATLPDFGKLIPHAVAAERLRQSHEITELHAADEGTRVAFLQGMATEALSRSWAAEDTFVIPQDAHLAWATEIASVLNLRPYDAVWTARNYLNYLDSEDRVAALDDAGREAVASLARSVLAFVTDVPKHARVAEPAIGVLVALGDDEANRDAIRSHIESPALQQTAPFVLYELARDGRLVKIATHDPALFQAITFARFGVDLEQLDSWQRFGSPSMPMQTQSSQNVRMFDYFLERQFEELLGIAPAAVCSVLCRLMWREGTASLDRSAFEPDENGVIPPLTLSDAGPVRFRGRTLPYFVDGSTVWDAGWRHEEKKLWSKGLAVFQARLVAGSDAERGALLDAILQYKPTAVIWRRLLKLAIDEESIRPAVVELLESPVVLREFATHDSAGGLLKVAFAGLDGSQRERIEAAILAVADEIDEQNDRRKLGERHRDALLLCLPDEAIVDEAVRQRKAAVAAAGQTAEPTPAVGRPTFGPISDDEAFRQDGIDLEVEPNASYRALQKQIQEISRASITTDEELEQWLERLAEYARREQTAEQDGVSSRLREYPEGEIAAGYQALAESLKSTTPLTLFDRVCEGLFVAAASDQPTRPSDPTEIIAAPAFDEETPHWSCPFARIEAAQGLCQAAWVEWYRLTDGVIGSDDGSSERLSRLLAMIRDLGRDPVPAVRYQVVSFLNHLWIVDRDLFWGQLDWTIENSRQVAFCQECLQALTDIVQSHGKGTECDRATVNRCAAAIDRIIEQSANVPNRTDLLHHAVPVQILLAIEFGRSESQAWLESVAADPVASPREATTLAIDCCQAMTQYGQKYGIDDSRLSRCRHLAERCLDGAIAAVGKVREDAANASNNDPELGEQRRTQFEAASGPLNAAAIELCKQVARTLHSREQSDATTLVSGAVTVSKEEGGELLPVDEASAVFGTLLDRACYCTDGFDAGQLVELFVWLIPIEPASSLRRLRLIAVDNASLGLASDSRIAGEVVRGVELLLANHREVLIRDDDSAARDDLIALLDAFASSGHRGPRQLLGKLEEVFRA